MPLPGTRTLTPRPLLVFFILFLLLPSCALQTDVTVYPMYLIPSEGRPFDSFVTAVELGDYRRAVSLEWSVEGSGRTLAELRALGKLEAASGRFALAREHLAQALQMKPSRAAAAELSWELSQAASLAGDFAEALRWARETERLGVSVKAWHLLFLESLASVPDVLQIPPAGPTRMALSFGSPDVPRIETSVNGSEAIGIIDTGAVLTVVSEGLAARANVRKLGAFEGTFLGLLKEPIPVTFGLIESLRIGTVEVRNVPVAIMPDEKLSFFVVRKQSYKMDLLLGANLLRRFQLDFVYSKEIVTLTPVASSEMPSSDPNIFYLDSRPVVPTTINRRGWHLFLIDTGSEITFLNLSTLQSTSVRGSTQLHGATLQGLGGSQKVGQKIGATELGLSGWGASFTSLPLYDHDSPAFGILGQNLLKQFRVVLDFGAMRLDFIQE